MLNILTNVIGSVTSTANGVKAKTKSLRDMLIDSAVIAGIALFSVWNGSLDLDSMLIVVKATGLAFAFQLAVERGLKKIL